MSIQKYTTSLLYTLRASYLIAELTFVMTFFVKIYNFKELDKRLLKLLQGFHYMPAGQFLSEVNNQDSRRTSMDVILPTGDPHISSHFPGPNEHFLLQGSITHPSLLSSHFKGSFKSHKVS